MGHKKKKIVFGCQRRRLYTVQHAIKMKNKEAGAPVVSESSALYSQNVKKTLLRIPKDRGTRGVEGLSMPRRCITKRAKEMTDRCSFYFNITESKENARWIVGRGGNVEHCGHAKRTAAEASQPSMLVAEEDIKVTNSVMAANAGSGAARDILFARTGEVVPLAGLRYQQLKARVASEFGMAMKGIPTEVFLEDLMNFGRILSKNGLRRNFEETSK